MTQRKLKKNGYTLTELMIVVIILSLMASILTPQAGLLLRKAYQAKAKSNLGILRSAINIYYTDREGNWPLANYPEGLAHYTVHGVSMSETVAPFYLNTVPTPKLYDQMNSYNNIPGSFDSMAEAAMALNPPRDVFIIWGPADYTDLLSSPYAYDNQTGLIYYPNGNLDYSGSFFYDW